MVSSYTECHCISITGSQCGTYKSRELAILRRPTLSGQYQSMSKNRLVKSTQREQIGLHPSRSIAKGGSSAPSLSPRSSDTQSAIVLSHRRSSVEDRRTSYWVRWRRAGDQGKERLEKVVFMACLKSKTIRRAALLVHLSDRGERKHRARNRSSSPKMRLGEGRDLARDTTISTTLDLIRRGGKGETDG